VARSLLEDENLAAHLPAVFRTISGLKSSRAQSENLIKRGVSRCGRLPL
jgi:hypothetical protein